MGRLLLSMDSSVNFGHGGDLVAPLLLKIKLFLFFMQLKNITIRLNKFIIAVNSREIIITTLIDTRL